jgi:hypothetical protein
MCNINLYHIVGKANYATFKVWKKLVEQQDFSIPWFSPQVPNNQGKEEVTLVLSSL